MVIFLRFFPKEKILKKSYCTLYKALQAKKIVEKKFGKPFRAYEFNGKFYLTSKDMVEYNSTIIEKEKLRTLTKENALFFLENFDKEKNRKPKIKEFCSFFRIKSEELFVAFIEDSGLEILENHTERGN